jgi:ABC-type Fe3+-siderophore transport system permease subunit
MLLAATLGAPVPLSDLWSSDAEAAEVARQIFWRTDGEWGLRPVRIMAGLLIGASLASSGAALQSVFRNPLAEPYLLGISSGGALGATVGLWLQERAWAIHPDMSWLLAFRRFTGCGSDCLCVGRKPNEYSFRPIWARELAVDRCCFVRVLGGFDVADYRDER